MKIPLLFFDSDKYDRNYVFGTLLCLFTFLSLFPQNSADIKQNEAGIKFSATREAAKAKLSDGFTDEAEALVYQNLEFALETGINAYIDSAQNEIGNHYFFKGNYKKAKAIYESGLNWRLKTGLRHQIGNSYSNIGLCYLKSGNPLKAVNYFINAFREYRLYSSDKALMHLFNYTGAAFVEIGKYKEASTLFYQALKLSGKFNDLNFQSEMLSNIGVNFYRQGNSEAAFKALNASLNLSRSLPFPDQNHIASILTNLGSLYGDLSYHQTAFRHFNEALATYTDLGDSLGICYSLSGLGLSLIGMGENNRGISFLYRALEISEAFGLNDVKSNLYTILANSEAENENYEAAFKLCQKKQMLQDSLINSRMAASLENLESSWQVELKKLENKSLNERLIWEKRKALLFLTIGILSLLFVISIIWANVYFRRSQLAQQNALENEIAALKSEQLVKKAIAQELDANIESTLNRKSIEINIEAKLNETDWNILQTLTKTPTLTNKELAQIVSLSQEGVRSSLKKLYKLFELEKSKENQRLALIIKALKLSE